MGEKDEYPKRPGHFAHKFARLLAKSCVANTLTAEACWLLTVIAHTEDAGGYRHAVTFHNGQLMAFCGFGSVDKLERVRRKVVEAGWLHYIPGKRGAAARYWVVVPAAMRGKDDLPSDECEGKYEAAESTRPESQHRTGAAETAVNLRVVCGQSAAETAVNLRNSSSLNQNLNQDPLPPAGEDDENPGSEDGPRPPRLSEVIELWNAQPKLTPCRSSDSGRDRRARDWATSNPDWRRHWRAVIEFMGRSPHYHGEVKGWVPTLDWLFRDSNFAKTLDAALASVPPPPPDPRKQRRAMLLNQVALGAMDRAEAEESFGGPLDGDDECERAA